MKKLNFKGLGSSQLTILQQMQRGASIIERCDVNTGEKEIILVDQAGDCILDISRQMLNSLVKRGLLNWREESVCLQLEVMRWFLNQQATI